jgi:hypothetical protein
MTVTVLTEAEARTQWSGDLLLVRQQRIAFLDLGVMLLRTVVILMVTLPLWRAVFTEMSFLPYWVALLVAVAALLASHFMGKDIEAARHPQAWLLVANRKTIWVRFRSYVHWRWPVEDLTVVRIDLDDIDHLVPLRFTDGTPPELCINLKEPLPDEVIDAILEENIQLWADRWTRSRIKREPVVVEKTQQALRIRWAGEYPTLREACDKFRLNFPIEPPLRLEDSEDGIMHDRPRITDDALAEINELLRAGDREGAIRVLREATGMGLAQARALVDQTGWQKDEPAEQPKSIDAPMTSDPSAGDDSDARPR